MGKENQFRTVLSVSVSEQIRQNGPEDSSHMNKTVMFVQKLESTSNWVSRKGAVYAFSFWLPKLEVCVERGQAQRGKSSRSFCAWICSPEKSEKTLTTFLQAKYLRQKYVAGVYKGRKRRGRGDVGIPFNSRFYPPRFSVFEHVIQAKNTE